MPPQNNQPPANQSPQTGPSGPGPDSNTPVTSSLPTFDQVQAQQGAANQSSQPTYAPAPPPTPGVAPGPPPQPPVAGPAQVGQFPTGPNAPIQPGAPGQIPPNQPLNSAKTNPNSTQNTLQVSEIRDGIMIMSDGSYRAVIYTKSINFDLMSPQEREAVEQGYQGFINSLYFPVQIYIRSQRIDMRPYLENLSGMRDSQSNMLLAMLMDDYIGFIGALVEQANIMDKNFYLIIPFFPPNSAAKAVQKGKGFFSGVFGNSEQVVSINEADLQQAKTELTNRVQAVLNGLTQMGLQAVPLDTQELIELFYDSYNPDTATRQQLAPMGDLEAPLVTKGQGEAQQPHLDQAGF